MMVEVGRDVTLSCSFSSSHFGTYYLLWYRQYSGSAPQFLSFSANRGIHSYTDPTALRRFTSEVKSKLTNLLISDVKTEDSATYLCALKAAQRHTYNLSSYTYLVLKSLTAIEKLFIWFVSIVRDKA
ncbi:hypothetical protein GDO81_001856 [Engystomops pustulosus]|uniref:Ig-like domain-containing protein n=1 Tax=Engystomops pustulosus TaxID=76066 RepID=A0AAV7DFQ2_ENGPU|nr:hypothetical protein GDO81_001856 [Engystomops pustulosus]